MDYQSFRPLQELRKAFKTEDSRFLVYTGLKVAGISFFINVAVYTYLFQLMRLNYVFFKAQGMPYIEDETVFFHYLFSEASGNLTVFLIFHFVLFFIGTYVGWLILRPFRVIGEYCENVINEPNMIYKIDEFSTYKLLTRFSEFFFEYLREGRRKGAIVSNSIPPQFSRIHGPVTDRVFMLHFGLLLIIVAISSILFIIENATSIYIAMVELATKTIKNQAVANKFFGSQLFILDDLTFFSILLFTVSYFALGFHLYDKVSGAAFGIFSTMRSFMKGNHFSRVHLVGYGYIRDYTRKLNKYLDYIQNNFDKPKSDG
jgi:hypothetical protein